MQDDNPGENTEQKPSEDDPAVEFVTSPAPPDNKSAVTGTTIDKHQKSDIQGIKDDLKRAEKWMIWLTGAIAFFGLCTVIVGVLQWMVIRGQLGEMKSGGTDTHNLAVAAGKQADAAITSQRPWLKVTATISGPFVFDQYGGRVSIKYRIENTGRSVALRIQLKDGLGAAGSKLPDPFAERLAMCDALRKEPGSRGDTLFAGDHLDITAMLVMQPDRLRDALIVSSREDQRD